MKENFFVKKVIPLLITGAIFLTGCVSTTMIHSIPEGAKLYINDEPVGTTPYLHRDTRIVGSTTRVRLEQEGYKILNASFSRNEEADAGAIIGGVFLYVPFLWTMKYKPTHTYELKPVNEGGSVTDVPDYRLY
jgi:hypothetical protein